MAKTLSFTDTSAQIVKIGDTTTSFTLICGNDNVATDLTNVTSITAKLGNASGYLKSATVDPASLTDPTTGQVTVKFSSDLMTSLPAGNYYIEVWVVDSIGTSIYPSDRPLGFTITNNIQSTNGDTITTITFDDFVKELKEVASTISNNNIADGSITTGKVADGTVTGSKLASAVQSSIGQAIANDRLAYAITDSQDNRSWIEIDPDGNPTTNSAQRLAPKVRPELLPDQGAQAGVSFSVVDSDGKMSDLTIDDSGRILIDTVADQATRANLMTKTDMSVIRAIGDSLTDGGGGSPNPSWTETLQADLPSVKVENFGISGQASGMVTFRMGLNHVTITEIDGGKLPGDGSEVAVTFKSSIGDGRNMLNGGVFCKLAGAKAYFLATDTNKGTIKLSKPGNDVSVAVPAALAPDTDVDRYSDGKTDLDKMAIIWMGKNDSIFATGKGWEDGCMANIKAVINSLSPQIKSYIVIGITNDSTEGVGTSRYSEIIKFNARLADLTPGYVDLRSYMVHQCIYDMGLTPTADDLASMTVDAPPAQIMRPDHTHFIAEARPFESRYILKQLQMRGWYKNDNATKTA